MNCGPEVRDSVWSVCSANCWAQGRQEKAQTANPSTGVGGCCSFQAPRPSGPPVGPGSPPPSDSPPSSSWIHRPRSHSGAGEQPEGNPQDSQRKGHVLRRPLPLAHGAPRQGQGVRRPHPEALQQLQRGTCHRGQHLQKAASQHIPVEWPLLLRSTLGLERAALGPQQEPRSHRTPHPHCLGL